jgi:putative protein kinase ArgK-like GTPase of G3E family
MTDYLSARKLLGKAHGPTEIPSVFLVSSQEETGFMELFKSLRGFIEYQNKTGKFDRKRKEQQMDAFVQLAQSHILNRYLAYSFGNFEILMSSRLLASDTISQKYRNTEKLVMNDEMSPSSAAWQLANSIKILQ